MFVDSTLTVQQRAANKRKRRPPKLLSQLELEMAEARPGWNS